MPWPACVRSEHFRAGAEGCFIELAHGGLQGASRHVVLVHGLGGGATRPYMARAARTFGRAGFAVTGLGLRRDLAGCHRYHMGLYQDIELALGALHASADEIYLLGFSGGGSVVLNFLARSSMARRVRAAACLSAPLDLSAVAAFVESEGAAFYHRHLVRGLGARVASLTEYDERVLVPDFGFANAAQYRTTMSAGPELSRIATRTLLIESADDPVVPARLNDAYASGRPDNISRIVTSRGGHIGWVQSLAAFARGETWALKRVCSFFTSLA